MSNFCLQQSHRTTNESLDKDVLTKATTFEVSFVTVDGGGTQVSWGSSGNAFAAGVGDGFGVFGGSGGWTNVG